MAGRLAMSLVYLLLDFSSSSRFYIGSLLPNTL